MRASGVRRFIRRGCALVLAMVPVWVTALGACDATNAVVGGSCAAGHTDCDGVCVEVVTDPDNCGACGHVCASGMCVGGSCGSHTDGSTDARRDAPRDGGTRDAITTDGTTHDGRHDTSDGATLDAPSLDVAKLDGPRADGTLGDGTAADAPSTDGASTDACTPPYTTTSSCGACGAMCPAGDVCTPVLDAGADAGTYACAPLCTAPLTDCGGTCVDLTSDPLNCGACDRVCPSGICIMSMCAGSALGDIVVIGHDYASSNVRVSEGDILANAVFLPPTNPLRVLSFEEYAVATQVANVKSVLKKAALTSGRQINFTVVDDYTLVPADLAASSFDVLLVYDQGNAAPGTLSTVGSAWQASVETFVEIGGDVVVLDGASGANPQMTDLLTSASLLDTTAEVRVASGTQLFVVASGDAVGNFVVSPYAAQTDTVSFVTSATNGGNITYVVDDGSDAAAVPVVIHRIP
jgi:hypothetical protein